MQAHKSSFESLLRALFMGQFSAGAWAASIVAHLVLLVALGLWHVADKPGRAQAALDFTASFSAGSGAQGNYYDDESPIVRLAPRTVSAAQLLDEPLAALPSNALPANRLPLDDAIGGAYPSAAPSAPNQLFAAAGSRSGGPPGEPGQATGGGSADGFESFGLKSPGLKCVYVFDRSSSMSGPHQPLERAKRELLASLGRQSTNQQFQIVFYNHQPHYFADGPGRSRLLPSTPVNLSKAAAFVRGVVADGSTEHEPALMTALALAPHVIYFLTDGDEPRLSPSQLQRIQLANRGRAIINAIEFGYGPRIDKNNFLYQIARQNGGEYTYVDLAAD